MYFWLTTINSTHIHSHILIYSDWRSTTSAPLLDKKHKERVYFLTSDNLLITGKIAFKSTLVRTLTISHWSVLFIPHTFELCHGYINRDGKLTVNYDLVN